LDRHPFDALYVERLRAGDAETERHFCSYLSDLIRLKVCARGMARHLDDIRQETFLRVLRTLRSPDGLRDPGALGSFVNSVCGNVIHETGRGEKFTGADPPLDFDKPDPAAISPEEELLAAERAAVVRLVIEQLDPRERELLNALFLEDRDRDRVCERMGVTRDYLRVLVYRAKHDFKTRYLASTGQRASR